MPAIRGTQKVSAYTSRLRSTDNHSSFDPLTYHKSLGGHQKAKARSTNNENLRKAVELVAPPRPTGYPLHAHKPGHRLLPSRLCYGITNPGMAENIGQWYHVVRNFIMHTAQWR